MRNSFRTHFAFTVYRLQHSQFPNINFFTHKFACCSLKHESGPPCCKNPGLKHTGFIAQDTQFITSNLVTIS